MEALRKINPDGAYALCPLIEESDETVPSENTAPSDNDTFKFEIGKYYRHSSGKEIAILGEVDTTMYGKVFVAESNRESNLRPVGQSNDHARDWVEISKEEWMKNFNEGKVSQDDL